jgi:hypothetical protein
VLVDPTEEPKIGIWPPVNRNTNLLKIINMNKKFQGKTSSLLKQMNVKLLWYFVRLK